MAKDADATAAAVKEAAAPNRRLSFTERLRDGISSGREWITGFYGTVGEDIVTARQGIADSIDDFLPETHASSERRRNSNLLSEGSEGTEGTEDVGHGREGITAGKTPN